MAQWLQRSTRSMTFTVARASSALRCTFAAARLPPAVALTEKSRLAWTLTSLSTAKSMPGFGHRFHPVDPRVAPLLKLVDAAAAEGIVSGRFAAIGRGVEASLKARTRRNLPMNIDGATAVVYGELGFAPALARGLFILSRSVGILAHAWEQSQQNHRIKGPMPPEIPYTYLGS
jgi:citrate synthase